MASEKETANTTVSKRKPEPEEAATKRPRRDELPQNTVGDIPMEWYEDYDHIGYDIDGNKLMKNPERKDALDKLIDQADNPNYWRTVYDEKNDREVVLTDKEVSMIRAMQAGRYPEGYDPYEPLMEFKYEDSIHPLTNQPKSKRSFVPSRWEYLRVKKLVKAIDKGWIKLDKEKIPAKQFYLIWDQEQPALPYRPQLPAPKSLLPGHAESYNPPAEYLFTEEERQAWLESDPTDRTTDFIPQKYNALREVPGFDLQQQMFQRCLDLYLCPRVKRIRKIPDPEALIPQLPSPSQLRPYPSEQAMLYAQHTGPVRSISLSPNAHWLVSGGDDKQIIIWEVDTGRCFRKINVGDVVYSAQWNPAPDRNFIAVAVGNRVLLIDPMLESEPQTEETVNMLNTATLPVPDETSLVRWEKPNNDESLDGIAVKIIHEKPVKQIVWHHKGDYFATLTEPGKSSVLIHQLSKRQSQNPFKKSKGDVQSLAFHPIKPYFLVATQRYIRIYDLVRQALHKKLSAAVQWLSSVTVHPSGDHVIAGSYDKRLCWFDLDLSTKPYKIMRNHKMAIRAVAVHKQYPLFASSSDDGTINILHGMVYSDLSLNTLIVPLKFLKGHQVVDDLGVLDIKFHPTQPWLFSSGADGTIRLFT